MTQSIIIQVGQCGNQIGSRFWDLALHEHASVNSAGLYDDALKSFFHNIDLKTKRDLSNDKNSRISSLKARAVLVDMEEGVIAELRRGPMKEIFDSTQIITDVSGSGNNWAVGNLQYGRIYHDSILNLIRKQVEKCDSLQCFFLIHSLGGGTGSGIGTAILSLLQDEFPDVYRFCIPVYPSGNDDVITSPYNTILAMERLTNHADCVIPLENQALLNICEEISKSSHKTKRGTEMTSNSFLKVNSGSKKPFDEMNNIAANMLLHLTCSSRFGGNLNVDLSEISANLVPYPRMHYLISGLTPLYLSSDIRLQESRLDQMFKDSFSSSHQLMHAKPSMDSVYLACALLARGDILVSDVRRNIDRLQLKMKFAPWNNEGWKIGLCKTPSVGQPRSLLSLTNNTCLHNNFSSLKSNFLQLYSRKAHIHHYTQVDGMDQYLFDSSLESLTDLIEDYKTLEKQAMQSCVFPRLKVATA